MNEAPDTSPKTLGPIGAKKLPGEAPYGGWSENKVTHRLGGAALLGKRGGVYRPDAAEYLDDQRAYGGMATNQTKKRSDNYEQ